MNIDLIFRIAAIGILVSVLNALLNKSGRKNRQCICFINVLAFYKIQHNSYFS